jgi:hypothetical protein
LQIAQAGGEALKGIATAMILLDDVPDDAGFPAVCVFRAEVI